MKVYDYLAAEVPVDSVEEEASNYHHVQEDLPQLEESVDIDNYQALAASVHTKEKPGSLHHQEKLLNPSKSNHKLSRYTKTKISLISL